MSDLYEELTPADDSAPEAEDEAVVVLVPVNEKDDDRRAKLTCVNWDKYPLN